MKGWFNRGAPVAVLLAAALMVVPASAQQISLMQFSGYDFFWPGALGDAGSCYSAATCVTTFDNYLVGDFVNNEYTLYIAPSYNLCWTATNPGASTDTHFYMPSGGPATVVVYEDAIATGTAKDYGINPPNLQESTFLDGTLILSGEIVGQVVIVEFTSGPNMGNGTLVATVNWNGGSQLSNIPVDERLQSLTLAGLTFQPLDGPEGYTWQVDGQSFTEPSTAVENTTWGSLKRQLQDSSN